MTTAHRETELATALLEAHVAFLVDELTGERLPTIIEVILDTVLEHADGITLAGAVSKETIKAVARTYATDLDIKGGIPELSAEITRWLHAHPIHQRTTLGDLLSERRFERLAEHAFEFRALRARILHGLVASPLYETFASDLLYNGIRDYLASGMLAPEGAAARSAKRLRDALRRRRPGFEGSMEEAIKGYIATSIRAISERTVGPLVGGEHDEQLFEVVVDSWRIMKDMRIGELRDEVTAQNLEELFVTGYEWWQEMRRTEYVGTMIDSAIDALFDKYGDTTLSDLLDDLGITREIMLGEGLRFGPEVITAVHREGLFEPLVREALAPFYRSGQVEKVLAKRANAEPEAG